ncbi:hypothetical protein B0T21DRAFT_50920 [Apiosordaria backusii]|uniref:Uncharacterized protein n=1 Tax=Apiosordaria backusii TaxID=314023 RepID=A0AA40ASW9_9PEZI|nr:hypothetical protein B0T21DRAFT_50920 [Apiosordaria backusii]
MKFDHIRVFVLLSTSSVPRVFAGCECWWEGTAPFCDSSCPSDSRSTGIFSDSGDGGSCITGQKQKCVRCGPNIAEKPCCIPTHTCATCQTFLGIGVMVCHEVVTDVPPVECGTHICGVCIGSGSSPNLCAPGVKYEEWTPPRPGDANPTPWNPFTLLPS